MCKAVRSQLLFIFYIIVCVFNKEKKNSHKNPFKRSEILRMAVACNMILHPVSSIDRWYEHEFSVFSSSLLHFSTVILIHSKVVAYVCAYILINVFVCPRYFFSSVVFRYAYPPPPPSSCRIWCIRIIESFVFEWRKKWREKKTMIENDTCFPCIVLDGVNIPYTCNVCDVILLLFFFCSTIFFSQWLSDYAIWICFQID